MMHLTEENLGDIPVLHIVQKDLEKMPLPTVIYYHGYNGEKESSLTLAYKIAEKGYRVILPDCLYHGSRKKEMSKTDLNLAFWDIVIQTIEELPALKDALVAKGYSEENRIGIGGTSMGGIVTYGALVRYNWIKTAAVLMGTAYMTDYASALIDTFNQTNEYQVTPEEQREVDEQLVPYDMSIHPNKLDQRPLFIWHGEDDKVVPYKYSAAFYETIQSYYEDKTYLKFVREQGRSHHISKQSMNGVADWFDKFL